MQYSTTIKNKKLCTSYAFMLWPSIKSVMHILKTCTYFSGLTNRNVGHLAAVSVLPQLYF